jgi:ATP-dependent exoDNAse (exonuclease V) beta subunit
LTAGIDYTGDRGFIRKRIGQFRTLAAQYDREGERDLEGFVAFCENTQMRDKADPRTVQVITIHRSKGLEYDVVYMPRLNDSKIRMSQPRSGQLLTLKGPDFKPSWLLCSPGEAVTQLDDRLAAAQAEAKAESGYGSLCKLYVGMTRAKHRLVLISNELSKSQQTSFDKNNTTYDIALFLEKVLPDKKSSTVELKNQPDAKLVWASDANDDGWITTRIAAEEKKAAKLGASAKPKAVDASGFSPATRLKRVLPSKGNKHFTRAWQPQTDDAKGMAFGTVVHGYFAHLEWDADAFLAKIGELPMEEVSIPVKTKAIERIRRCLAVPEIREILLTKPSGDALLWCERDAVLRNANGEYVSCQFDRVHIVPGKRATIFDFKTDGGTLPKLLDNYRHQMGMYRDAVAKLTGLKAEQVEVYLVHAHANNPSIAKVEF